MLGYDDDQFGESAERRRRHRMLVEFYGAVCAATAGEPHASLATCEKVPMSDEDAAPSTDYPETAEDLDRIPPALEALRFAVSRDRERQRKVLALVQAGEVAHARRLARCRRQSVQLECGDCGSDENYVPVSCDSPLCEDCMNRKMGEKAGQYLPTVKEWDHSTMMRLSLPERVDPDPEKVERAVDALRGAFGRLRRRVVPPSGDGYTWNEWRSVLLAMGERDLVARLESKYVRQGRGIPMDEILRGGFYGIDIKQGEDGTLNVHMHILANIPYLPQSALSSLWDDLIDAPVVDIRRVEEAGGRDEETALMEVIGYAAKAPEYESVEDEVAYFKALKGAKMLQPFGDLHGNTPEPVAALQCCTCERLPDRGWQYLGVVDGCYETAIVHNGERGDRPPPEP